MAKNIKHTYGDKMNIKKAPQALKYLWAKNFFDGHGKSFKNIKEAIKKQLHCAFPDATLRMALKRAEYLTQEGVGSGRSYTQKYSSSDTTYSEDIFPKKLLKALGQNFETEISDLNLNYGHSGTCTAFLLRKILEKLIFLTFAKNSLSDRLKDANGNFVGLKCMLNLCTSTKIQGTPFLMPRTEKEIEGIKFLGDTSAHNPLVNVQMKTIIPQMPFIITACEELSKKL
jgi:hypothetical protein